MKFKVKDILTGLWVQADDLAQPISLTEDERKAKIFKGERVRVYWQGLGYEIVEVK